MVTNARASSCRQALKIGVVSVSDRRMAGWPKETWKKGASVLLGSANLQRRNSLVGTEETATASLRSQSRVVWKKSVVTEGVNEEKDGRPTWKVKEEILGSGGAWKAGE